MGRTAKTIEVELKAVDKMSAVFKKAAKQAKTFGGKMEAMAGKMRKVGKSMTTYLTLPIVAAGGLMIKAASDAEETRSKFNTVFKSMVVDANKMADEFSKSFDLAGSTSRKLLGDTADLLAGFKFSEEAALDLSLEVNSLAIDLASFANLEGGAARASEILTKALLGERDSLVALGVKVLQEDLNARVLLNTKQGLVFETERQAEAYATLELVQEQSTNAMGDYARTSESTANVMRAFKEQVIVLAEEFGENLLPAFTNILAKVIEGIQWFGSLDESTQGYILTTGLLVAALGPLIFAIGAVTTAVKALGVALLWLNANPIALVIIAIVAIGSAGYKLITDWEEIKIGWIFIFQQMHDAVWSFGGAIKENFKIWGEWIDTIINKLVALQKKAQAAFESLSQGIGRKLDLKQYFADGGLVKPVYAAEGFPKRGTDTVPAMLTPGEVVLNASQQKNVAGKLGGGVTNIFNFSGTISSAEVAEEYADVIVKQLQLYSKVV